MSAAVISQLTQQQHPMSKLRSCTHTSGMCLDSPGLQKHSATRGAEWWMPEFHPGSVFTRPLCQVSPFIHPTKHTVHCHRERDHLSLGQRCISQGKEFLPAPQTKTTSIISSICSSQQGPFHIAAPATHAATLQLPLSFMQKAALNSLSLNRGSVLLAGLFSSSF